MDNLKGTDLAIIAHKLLVVESEWQQEKSILLREVRRLQEEVGLVTRRYEREIEDLVSRLQERTPPPVPVREKEEEEEEEREEEEEGEEEEAVESRSRRIVFARYPDLIAWSESSVSVEEWEEEIRLLEDPARKAIMVKKRGGGQVEVELLLRTGEAEDWEMMRMEFKAWMVRNGYRYWQRAAMEQGKNGKRWDEKVRRYALQRNGLKYMLE
ncbi:hypothetical protein Q9L58_006950 [Maublancomyces gigas]|uniref:Uncharacterized protein n=1 Tax=Discina gigas TaxID=1032678 RepID=A0ABR3GE62_9PEZI